MTENIADRYPRTLELNGTTFKLRLMRPEDEGRVLAFAAKLPRHDLLFLQRHLEAAGNGSLGSRNQSRQHSESAGTAR